MHGGQAAGSDVLVTGANGGVGTVAISLLSRLGYRVVASTGRLKEADFLQSLGAAEVMSRDEFSSAGKPLAKERWAAGVDSVGSNTLANVISMTRYGGAVAACGLAQGMDIGVDLEMDRPIQDTTLWSEQILGPKERDEFQKKSLSEQPSLLLRSWTLKEAILKCAGGTFFGDALKIQISADSLKLIDLPEAYGKIANWDICHFDFDLQGRKAHCAYATRSLSAE